MFGCTSGTSAGASDKRAVISAFSRSNSSIRVFMEGWYIPSSMARMMPWIARSIFRSEEHTSELQSLMRISYAVFCLKKKTNSRNQSSSELTYDTHDNLTI